MVLFKSSTIIGEYCTWLTPSSVLQVVSVWLSTSSKIRCFPTRFLNQTLFRREKSCRLCMTLSERMMKGAGEPSSWTTISILGSSHSSNSSSAWSICDTGGWVHSALENSTLNLKETSLRLGSSSNTACCLSSLTKNEWFW